MKLCVIGLGKMGTALIQGIINNGLYQPAEIIGCDIMVEAQEKNEDCYGIRTVNDNRTGVERAEIILLAVKPQVVDKVLADIADLLKGKLVISIAAGIDLGHLESFLPASKIVRVMPNTPLLVKEGISAITLNQAVTNDEKEIVREIFTGVGEVIEVKEELMDAVTGLSGSGPAYVYLIIEALADGGVLNGLPREMALKLAAQTVLGSARMVLETGRHPGELKDMVTSPGGTTIRGVEALEKGGLRAALMEAVNQAASRSRELNELS